MVWHRRGFGHCFFDGHLKTNLLEPLDQPARTAIRMQSVIVVPTKFLIYSAVLDNVPSDDQHAMSDCECRLLTTAFYGYTSKQGSKVAILFTQQRPGALRQNSSQIPVAFARGTGVPLARTFVVAG